MTNRSKTLIVKIVTICGTLLLTLLGVINVIQIAKINKLNKKSESLDIKIAELTEQKSNLEETAKNHATDTYIEDYARNNYDMIKDGDVIVIIK